MLFGGVRFRDGPDESREWQRVEDNWLGFRVGQIVVDPVAWIGKLLGASAIRASPVYPTMST